MRIAFPLALALSLGACSVSTTETSTAAGTVKQSHVMVSDGVCDQTTYKTPVEGVLGTIKEGKCPTTVKVDGATATVVKVCASFVDEAGDTRQFVQFSKDVDATGETVTVDASTATANCETLKTTYGG